MGRTLSHPFRSSALLAVVLALGPIAASPAAAQQAGYGQTLGTEQQQRQLLDGGTNPNGRGGTILESTNPIDLMNKLRRASAMDDATPPGSAVDQALRDFEAQTTAPKASPASTVRTP
ncbi:hypothetical protein NZK33_12495 [Cyanobium sp. FGCU-6]|jgi:hypothetical protein|nr:hypothetical protein [Cyanobium sp. FGCU6]